MPRYRFDDEDVVVIVGSGAGRRDAGQRALPEGRQGRRPGGRPPPHARRLHQRRVALVHAARLARQAHDVGLVPHRARTSPTCPPGRARPSAARPMHWAGCCPRFMPHEFKASTYYDGIEGVNALDWPISLRRRRALLRPRRGQDRHHDDATASRRCRPTTTTRCSPTARSAIGYKRFHSGRYAVNPVPRDGRPATLQDGFTFQGDKVGAKWSTLVAELPKAAATGKLDLRPESHVIRVEHDEHGLRHRRHLHRRRRPRAVPARAPRLRRRQRDRDRAAAAQLGLQPVPGRPRELVRPGGAQLHAPPDGVGLRAPSTSPCACTAARRWPGTSRTTRPTTRRAGSSAATTCSCCRSACRSWPRSSTRAPGAGSSRRSSSSTRTWPGCGSSARTCRRRPTASRSTRDVLDQHGQPVPDVHFDDHPNDLAMREHAWAAGEALYGTVGAVRTWRTPPYPATHNIGTARMSERPEDGVVNAFGQAHDVPNLFVSDAQPVHDGRRREPDADDRRAGHPPGRVHRRAAADAGIPTGHAVWDGRDPGGSVPGQEPARRGRRA